MSTTHCGSNTAAQFPMLVLTQPKIYSETLITGMQVKPHRRSLIIIKEELWNPMLSFFGPTFMFMEVSWCYTNAAWLCPVSCLLNEHPMAYKLAVFVLQTTKLSWTFQQSCVTHCVLSLLLSSASMRRLRYLHRCYRCHHYQTFPLQSSFGLRRLIAD